MFGSHVSGQSFNVGGHIIGISTIADIAIADTNICKNIFKKSKLTTLFSVCYDYNAKNCKQALWLVPQGLFLCFSFGAGADFILSPHPITEGSGIMPYRSNTPCKHPGCAKLVPYGSKYCSNHEVLHKDDRVSSGRRGYNSKWQTAREKFLAKHPLCVECYKKGVYVKATVVDHVVAHRGDQMLFWDESNWQALCKPCHDRKTRSEDSNPTYDYRF